MGAPQATHTYICLGSVRIWKCTGTSSCNTVKLDCCRPGPPASAFMPAVMASSQASEHAFRSVRGDAENV